MSEVVVKATATVFFAMGPAEGNVTIQIEMRYAFDLERLSNRTFFNQSLCVQDTGGIAKTGGIGCFHIV